MSVEVRQVRSTVWKRHATQTAAARAMGVTGGRLSNYLNRAGGSKLVPGVDAINGHVARRGAGDDGSESEADDSESEDEADGAEEGDASCVAASAAAGEAPSADAAAAAAGCASSQKPRRERKSITAFVAEAASCKGNADTIAGKRVLEEERVEEDDA